MLVLMYIYEYMYCSLLIWFIYDHRFSQDPAKDAENPNSSNSQPVVTEATDKTADPGQSQSSLTKVAPIVHQDLRKIRVDPAFLGEDNQELQLDDVQDDSDVDTMSDDDDGENDDEKAEIEDDLESGNEKVEHSESIEKGKRKTSVNDGSKGKSKHANGSQRMVVKDANAKSMEGEIIDEDKGETYEDNGATQNDDTDQDQDTWIAVPIKDVKQTNDNDRALDDEVKMVSAMDNPGCEGIVEESDSSEEEDAIDISDSDEEVVDLDSDSDEMTGCIEKDSKRNLENVKAGKRIVENPLSLDDSEDENCSDNEIVDSDSDSENVNSSVKSKQSVKSEKSNKKKHVSVAKLASKRKQTRHSREAKRKGVVQTPSGKFSVTPNKYTTSKQKTGKKTE